MSPSDDPIRAWEDATSQGVRNLIERDPVAVLPLAAIEQHGPHLPLSTDRIIGEGLLRAAFRSLTDDTPVLELPMQSFGASLEHEAFAGTLSLAAATVEALVFDLGASLARAGVRRLVVSNSHGGNRAALATAGLRLRRTFGMLVVKVHYVRLPRPGDVDLPEAEWTHGLHGGAVETAMMLHLRPDLVRHDEVRSVGSLGQELEEHMTHLAPEGAAAFSWSAEDLAAEGVVGDATLADAAMGERLVAHYGGCLADVVRDARRFPLERLGSGVDGPGRAGSGVDEPEQGSSGVDEPEQGSSGIDEPEGA